MARCVPMRKRRGRPAPGSIPEALADWQPGADPQAAVRVLLEMHRQWENRAQLRWPWLRPVGAAADLVEELYARVCPELAARADLTPRCACSANACLAGWPRANGLPAIAVQGLLSLSDAVPGPADASAWIKRLDAAARRIYDISR